MTALEMNAELISQLSIIARNETMMEKLLKYAKKLTAKKDDPTLMTKEEFFARIDRAKEGPMYAMLPGESYSDFRKRIGR